MSRTLSTITLTLTVTFFLSILTSCAATGHVNGGKKDISPFEFGLAKAKTGVERYNVLLKAHKAAVAKGVNVDYTGIDTIKLEIPTKPTRIPLTQHNDFKGCVIMVKNTVKDCWLFGKEEKGTPITVSKSAIDAGDFRSIESLKNGRFLLLIEDENPWVLKRRGHDYGHKRKDILQVVNGLAQNSATMPYDNSYSSPKCTFIKIKVRAFVMKNLHIERVPSCTNLTHVCYISGFNDVRISNVSIRTPESTLINDRGIRVFNCTNVSLEDVRIYGTYSRKDHSGYGISLNNIWNFKGVRLYGKANWGIFGNNNINTARIEDSQINRFDIHCYGRDLSFENVKFFDLYNQYSSTFGTISYKNCMFDNFVPVLNGGSYNAFVEHTVFFYNCVMNATKEKYFLCQLSHLDVPANARHELAEKCLPNVTIKNMTVNLRDGAQEFLLFKCNPRGKEFTDIGGLSRIVINGLTINSIGDVALKCVKLSNAKVQTKRAVDCRMKDVTVNQPEKGLLSRMLFSNEATLIANMPLKGGMVIMKNVKNLKQ